MKPQRQIRTLGDMTRVHRADRPDHPAMFFGERITTYALLDERSNQAANSLIAKGIKPQTRIAILDKNSDAFFEVLFAAAKSNVVLVAVNWRLSPSEIAYVINDAEAEMLFVGQEYFSTIEQIRDELESVKRIVSLDARHSEWPLYEEWREGGKKTDPNISVAPEDVALQLYTSGT